MPPAGAWSTRPVFVSSTFTDFQAERELLQTFVFPELAERLRARHHDLEPIDLRLGVETATEQDEAQKALLVLGVCLHEVARSRPFLVVLLGDRYGWIPPADRACRAAEEAGLSLDAVGRSVTDLEVLAGLSRPDGLQPVRAFAYFRELDCSTMPEAVRHLYRDADRTRTDALKRRVREMLGAARCRTYSAAWDAERGAVGGLDQLRRLLVDDLWSDLDAETRRYDPHLDTWQDRERETLQAFVHETARDFTGRESLLDRLVSLATGPGRDQWGACVVGAAGSGKSSVAAETIRRLEGQAGIVLLAHAAGISPESGRVDRVLHRWSGELAARLGDVPPPAEDAAGEDLHRAFAALLGRMARRQRVAIVLDALNEFERSTEAQHLTWLPALWPANVRLIATATQGVEATALGRRPGCEQVALDSLSEAEAGRIVDAVYRRYRRRANPQVTQAIVGRRTGAGEPAHGNPLWLELACDEMNLLDPVDLARAARFPGAPDAQLVALQVEIAGALPADAQAMYGRMLQRAVQVAETILAGQHATGEGRGRTWAQGFSEAIAVSRGGWREYDFQHVLPAFTGLAWSELLFSSVRRAYRGHVLQRGSSGQWNFYHGQLRAAVASWFESPPEYVRSLHRALASHLDTLPPDNQLRQTERMHHRIGADDRPGAARLYALCEHGSIELRAATGSLMTIVRSREDGVAWIGSLLDETPLSAPERLLLSEKIIGPLHDAMANEGRVEQRRVLLTMVRERTARMAAGDASAIDRHFARRQHAVCLLRLGDLALDVGDGAEAAALYAEHLRFTEEQAADPPEPVTAQQDLAVALERLGIVSERAGHPEKAREYFSRQIEICRRVAAMRPADRGAQEVLAVGLERLGNLALARGDTDDTTRLLGEAAEAQDRLARLAGESRSPIALSIRARLAEAGDDISEARRLLGEAESLLRERALEAPDEVEPQIRWSACLDALGDLAVGQSDTDRAADWYGQQLEIAQRLAALIPEDVGLQRRLAAALMKLGDAALKAERPAAARPQYERSLALRERLHAQQPDDVQGRRDLGLAHERLGMLEDTPAADRVAHLARAVALYHEVYERMADHEEAARTLALGHFALAQALAGIDARRMEAVDHSARAHALLSDLRAAGRRLDPAASRLLERLDTQFGGSGRWTHPVAARNEAAYSEANLQGLLGSRAMAAGHVQEAEAAFTKALERAREANHPPTLVRAYGSLGDLKARTGAIAAGFDLLNRAVATAREHGLPVEEGQTLERVADLFQALGQRDKALDVHRERLGVAERAGHREGVALASASIGALYFEMRDFASAAGSLERAAKLFESLRMWPQLAQAFSYLGYAHQATGDLKKAVQAYSDHIALSERLGDPGSAAGSMANLSLLLHAAGDVDRAIALGDQACDLLDRVGAPQAAAIRANVDAWKRAP